MKLCFTFSKQKLNCKIYKREKKGIKGKEVKKPPCFSQDLKIPPPSHLWRAGSVEGGVAIWPLKRGNQPNLAFFETVFQK